MRTLFLALIVASAICGPVRAQDNSGWRKDYRDNRADQRANEAIRRENARTDAILGRMGPNAATSPSGGNPGGGTGSGCAIELSCPAGQYFAVHPRCRCVTPGSGGTPSCPKGMHWTFRKRCEPIGLCLDDENFHRLVNGDCIPRQAAFRCASGRFIDYSIGSCNNASWRWGAPSYLPREVRERFVAEAKARGVKAGKYDSIDGYRGSDVLQPPYAAPVRAGALPQRQAATTPKAPQRAPVKAPSPARVSTPSPPPRPHISLDVEPRPPGAGVKR